MLFNNMIAFDMEEASLNMGSVLLCTFLLTAFLDYGLTGRNVLIIKPTRSTSFSNLFLE